MPSEHVAAVPRHAYMGCLAASVPRSPAPGVPMMGKCRTTAPRALSSFSAVLIAVAFTAVAGDCAKAEVPHNGARGDWRVTVGAAGLYKPAFTGAKDYQAFVFPDLKVEYKNRFFASAFEGVGYNLVNAGTWRAGPVVRLDFGRPETDDNPFRVAGGKTDALRGLGDVDTSVEVGGFLEYGFGPFRYSLKLRHGLGGHQGLIGETALAYKGSADLFGRRVMYSFGPRATFADSDYNDAYFGISPSQSARSGLARYDPGAGLVSYGLGAFAVMPIAQSVSLGVIGAYDRLAGEAADSPLITERGEENQFMGGLRLTYEFRL